jgi:hypothetical protein
VTDEDGAHTAYLEQLGNCFSGPPDCVLSGAARDAGEVRALVGELRADLVWTAAAATGPIYGRGAARGGRPGGRRAGAGNALHPADRPWDESRRRPRR